MYIPLVQYLQEVDGPLSGGVLRIRSLVEDQVQNSDHVARVPRATICAHTHTKKKTKKKKQ